MERRRFTVGELEHIRISRMLADHEKQSMNAFWSFVIYWVLWIAAVALAIWHFGPF